MKHNNSYERCMFNQMKPIFATYFLRILQGQVSGFHTLNSFINCCKGLQFLIFWGTMAHILGPRNLTDCMPWCVVFMFSLLNWLVSERRLCYGSWNQILASLFRVISYFLHWKFLLQEPAGFSGVYWQRCLVLVVH